MAVLKVKSILVKGTLVMSLLIGGFVAGTVSPFAEASESGATQVQVNVDDKSIAGYLHNGTTLVSARSIGEALGRNVTWNSTSLSIEVESRLDTILEKGYIRVGTAGDYRPFTYFNEETNEFEGYDIDAAKKMAKDLGVEVKFVKTSWPTLMEDLLADKFDIAMGGITRNVNRQKTASLTQGYMPFGKSPLVNIKNKDKFKSLEDINQPDVTIGLNPGGTNQVFVENNLKNAQVTIIENNLDVPGLIAEGKYDVMITDNIEAILYASKDERLYAALTDEPFTIDEKGYLMHRGDPIFENWVELWMDEMKLKGEFDKLSDKWINN